MHDRSGRILEAAVGTGRNFPFYPPGSQVVGIDLSPAMLARAQRRRETAAAAVELRQMDVTQLDFPNRSFDAAVATLLFWALLGAAMRELRRVVKPGGVIRCLEYDQSGRRIRRTCQIFELPEGAMVARGQLVGSCVLRWQPIRRCVKLAFGLTGNR